MAGIPLASDIPDPTTRNLFFVPDPLPSRAIWLSADSAMPCQNLVRESLASGRKIG
jgi:hypothetical protein